jgi:GNAT superfamily N-acetyltransferase
MSTTNLRIHPVTANRWDDLVELFGPKGAYGGCWCMFNRQTTREYEECKGDENRRSLEQLVIEDRVPGLLAYREDTPVGWVSVAPRQEYGRLQRSRVTKPVDDVPVWSITCFVIHRKHRGEGIGTALLDAAVEYARERGAVAIEGYPVEPRADRMPDIYAWMGLASMFEAAGFTEIARRSETRPLMRLDL